MVASADALHFAPVHLFTVEGVPLPDCWTVSSLPNMTLLAGAERDLQRPARAAAVGLCVGGMNYPLDGKNAVRPVMSYNRACC